MVTWYRGSNTTNKSTEITMTACTFTDRLQALGSTYQEFE